MTGDFAFPECRARTRQSMTAPLNRFDAWGLTWESAFPLLPYPTESVSAPAVHIRAGVVEPSDGAAANGLVHIIGARRCIIDLPAIARFDVRDGETIIVQPFTDDLSAVGAFLRADAVPLLLHQRGAFGVMGSGIVLPNGAAAIFCGISGRGRSTLAAAFALRGYRALSDNIALIALDGAGIPYAIGDYPHLELWADSAEALGIAPGSLQPVRGGIQKYVWRLEGGAERRAAPIEAILHLKPSNRPQVVITEIAGAAKLPFLLHFVYKRAAAERMGRIGAYWEIAAALAESVRVFEVERPIEGGDLDALIHQIEALWTR
jgi:hypothetical protein